MTSFFSSKVRLLIQKYVFEQGNQHNNGPPQDHIFITPLFWNIVLLRGKKKKNSDSAQGRDWFTRYVRLYAGTRLHLSSLSFYKSLLQGVSDLHILFNASAISYLLTNLWNE